ncbi:hypothetical protein QIH01_23695 [Brevibacillus brevis]|uniref:hypothetical protein n=1 Tax=Brevibacillus brevis TaxID=1393 RepID=UPI0007D89AF2|nr:hypothetical protein [Brevibacillus brevis]WGV58455.1 hypothetical protein QIH01_23695 [Brevibacillus brevis]
MLLIGLLGLAAFTLLFAFSEIMALLITARFAQVKATRSLFPANLILIPQKNGQQLLAIAA